jgi:urea transporter
MNHILKTLGISTLSAYSTVLFSGNLFLGFLIFCATLFNPPAALTGLLGILFSNLLAMFLGVYEERIRKGLYGFNGLLVGLSVSIYHQVDLNLIIILISAIILLVFVTLSLEYILAYFFGLPVLSIPFVIVSIILYLSFYDYKGLENKQIYVFPYDQYFPEIPFYIMYYLKSLGGIFFQSSPWSGLCIALVLLISSRIVFFLSILGFGLGLTFHILLNGNLDGIAIGNVGFNYILTAIGVGGFFLIPSPSTFVLAGFAAVASALVSSFTKIFLVQFNIPVFALPFTSVTLLFIYVARLLRNRKFVFVDFQPGSPERNLDYYKTRLKRFGESGFYIRLPFSGKWKVSQGYDGKYTHKDSWKESLDFMAIGPDGKLRKGAENTASDFYTFGLNVLAPSAGRVIKVVNHIEDNAVGSVDTKNNWGNLIMIEHAPYFYSQISHLQKNSILVKEGDYIQVGTKLGLAGNSGRSLEPHIHLHFQSNPEIGSSTIPVSFTQYQDESNQNIEIKFNSIPLENEIVNNLSPDFNLKNFFSLVPGEIIKVDFEKIGYQSFLDEWKINLDLMGNRFIEDDRNNRLYFISSLDYFACLDYIGKKNTSLFFFFLATYRIPFVRNQSHFADKISYKPFSSLFIRFFKDLIHPFSDTVGFVWKSEVKEENSNLYIDSSILGRNQKPVYELRLNPFNQPPGLIEVRDDGGNQWLLKRK